MTANGYGMEVLTVDAFSWFESDGYWDVFRNELDAAVVSAVVRKDELGLLVLLEEISGQRSGLAKASTTTA